MTNDQLADELIERMNELIGESEDARKALGTLLRLRSNADGLADHPSIQVWAGDTICKGETVTFLGMLNGIVGTIDEGQRAGWGLIAAVVEQNGELIRFERTEESRG